MIIKLKTRAGGFEAGDPIDAIISEADGRAIFFRGDADDITQVSETEYNVVGYGERKTDDKEMKLDFRGGGPEQLSFDFGKMREQGVKSIHVELK